MARGSKTCPNCSISCGPRTKVCKGCKHEFVFKSKEEIQEKLQKTLNSILDGKLAVREGKKVRVKKDVGRPIIFALPINLMHKNGKLLMAVPPKSFTDEDILEWSKEMNDYVCPNSGKRFAIFVVFQYLDKFVKDITRNNRLRVLIRKNWIYWKEETYGLPTLSVVASK